MENLRTIFFDGSTYDPIHDRDRLKTLMERVFAFMLDRQWHTLGQIKAACGGSEASVSARLRDLRKERFGGHQVEHKRHDTLDGVWLYRLIPAWHNKATAPTEQRTLI